LSHQGSDQTTPAQPVLRYQFAGLTNTGMLRDHNEDAYRLPLDADLTTLAQKGHLYILADGMGGHQKGEVASAVTIETVHTEYYAGVPSLESDDPATVIADALSNAIEEANAEVMRATEGGGTTIVAAVLYRDMLITMNVGDSRAYLLRDNEFRLISKDHSLVQRLVELGKISEEEAINHPRRNVLYQALGQGTNVDIFTFNDKLRVDDIVVLCSDGLWSEVSDEQIKEVLVKATSPIDAARQLIDVANDSGGSDNITVIIIQVYGDSSAAESPVNKLDPDDTHPSLQIQRPPANS
jgi:PPM family protein phosphatase